MLLSQIKRLYYSQHYKSVYLNGICRACTLVSFVLCCAVRSCISLSATPQESRLLCPWDFLGRNTGVGCHFLLQGIFPTKGSNSHLLHWQADFFFFLTTEPPGKSLKLYFYLICVFICLIFAYYKLHDNSDLGFFCSWFPSLGLSWGLYKFFFINAGYMIE